MALAKIALLSGNARDWQCQPPFA
eukprot:COSAG03_NODE_17902_length_366_cov_0.573034_1_plen_23_part_01